MHWRADLSINVDQSKSDTIQDGGTLFKEEDIPNAQAGFQRKGVDKYAQEPLCADTDCAHAQVIEVRGKPWELPFDKAFEDKLVYLQHSMRIIVLMCQSGAQTPFAEQVQMKSDTANFHMTRTVLEDLQLCRPGVMQ